MKKSLKELTLLDKFLFDQTMDLPEAHEAMLQIILQDESLKLLIPPQTEKEVRTMPWLRSIRLDVFAVDENLLIYNTEMQKEYRKDLGKRSRYYQGLMDSSLLEPGETDFNRLNNTYIILIMPFDLFGAGRYCYTFHAYCDEDKNIELKDGATRIFLNTRGTNDDEVGQELRDLLQYIECTDGAFALRTGSERIQKIHACVSRIKSSEEMGVKYMQSWEEKIWDRQKGLALGKNVKIVSLVRKKLEKGWSVEEIADVLEEPEELVRAIMICMKSHPDYTDKRVIQELGMNPDIDFEEDWKIE